MHWPKKKLEIKEVMESVQDDLELRGIFRAMDIQYMRMDVHT